MDGTVRAAAIGMIVCALGGGAGPTKGVTAATVDTFEACSSIAFNAGANGRPPMSFRWSVRRAGGAGSEELVSHVGESFTWDTRGVELRSGGVFADGFESGDTAAWGADGGGSAEGAFGVTEDFEVVLNVSNLHGTDTESVIVRLEGLGEVRFGSPAIVATEVAAGRYELVASAVHAREWRWEVEDPGNGTSGGCEKYARCRVMEGTGSLVVEWREPNTAGGEYGVMVTARNCTDTAGASAEVALRPTSVGAAEPPTAIAMSIDVARSPGCIATFGATQCSYGSPILFVLEHEGGGSSLQIDWNGDGEWDQTVATTGGREEVSHTYNEPIVFLPAFQARNDAGGVSEVVALSGFLYLTE